MECIVRVLREWGGERGVEGMGGGVVRELSISCHDQC